MVSDPEKAKDSYKARTAVKYGIPVVGVAFLTSCVDRKKLLDTDDFLLVGNTKAQELSAGKIIGEQSVITAFWNKRNRQKDDSFARLCFSVQRMR